jgi:flagellar hook protein FlgE
MAKADGTVDTNGGLVDLKIPTGQVLAPVATTGAAISGNLSADAVVPPAVATPVTSQITMYDSLGNAHQISVTMTKSATVANEWTLTLSEATTPTATQLYSGTINFGATGATTGKLTTPAVAADGTQTVALDLSKYPSWTGPAAIDLAGLTQFGGKSDAAAKTNAKSGSAMGVLEGYSLSGDGTIVGTYSNGLRQNIGKLALATFTNPGGLEKAGNSSYRAGDNSGNPLVGAAGTGSRGTLTAGALEMSNVDLAEEFTGLIVAQRGFQANSRVITTSDEILQDLVQLKR